MATNKTTQEIEQNELRLQVSLTRTVIEDGLREIMSAIVRVAEVGGDIVVAIDRQTQAMENNVE